MKYQRFTPSGGKNISIRKLVFVTKTQFLLYPILITDEQGFRLKKGKKKPPELLTF